MTQEKVKLYINVTKATLLTQGKARTITAITRNGDCLVQDFIEALDVSNKKKILRQIKDTADNGPHPSRERFKVIESGMFELKRHQIRILGFFQPDNVMLLTHGCIKKKDDLEPQDIARAKALLGEYQANLKVKGGAHK